MKSPNFIMTEIITQYSRTFKGKSIAIISFMTVALIIKISYTHFQHLNNIKHTFNSTSKSTHLHMCTHKHAHTNSNIQVHSRSTRTGKRKQAYKHTPKHSAHTHLVRVCQQQLAYLHFCYPNSTYTPSTN